MYVFDSTMQVSRERTKLFKIAFLLRKKIFTYSFVCLSLAVISLLLVIGSLCIKESLIVCSSKNFVASSSGIQVIIKNSPEVCH